MRRTFIAIGLVAALAACSTSIPGGPGANGGMATLSFVNGTAPGSGARVTLDQAAITLGAAGAAAKVSITPGTHQIDVASSSGHHYGSIAFSIDPDSSRTVVVSGTADTAIVTMAGDSSIGSSGGGGPLPLTGHILLVNSAPGVGPFDVLVIRANVDSTLRFGGFSFGSETSPSASRYSFPFQPDGYTFEVVNPGGNTALATTVVTLATGDEWTVVLTKGPGGTLALAATKQ